MTKSCVTSTGSCALLQAASALLPRSGGCSTATPCSSQRQPVSFPLGTKHPVCHRGRGGPVPTCQLGTLNAPRSPSRCSQGALQSRWWRKTQRSRQHLPPPVCINYPNTNLTEHRDLKRQRKEESWETAEDHGHAVCGLILHIPASSQLWLSHLPRVQFISCGFSRNMNPKTRCTESLVHGIKASIHHVSSVSPIYSFCLLLSSDYNLLINNTLMIFSMPIYFLSH